MPSILSKALLASLKAMFPQISAMDVYRQREAQETVCKLVNPSDKSTAFKEYSFNNVKCMWISPKTGYIPNTEKLIVYFHGGAYRTGSLNYACILGARFAEKTGYNVLTFEYRLSPENKYPCALDDAYAVYEYILKLNYKPENILFTGESAGGNLLILLILKLIKENRGTPCAAVCLSPWTDMTLSAVSCRKNADKDPIIDPKSLKRSAHEYAGNIPLTDPELSPLYADMKTFPPTLIQAGGNEVLLDDSISFYNKLKKLNINCKLHIYEGMCHIFQLFPIPEAFEALDEAAHFIIKMLR